jgi:hypothetical protein
MNINTPGEAMEEVLATLRVHGYGADEVSSLVSVLGFHVTGNLSLLEDGKQVGIFSADIDEGANVKIVAGAFGVIEAGNLDPFAGL